ncbi:MULTISPECIES: flagellar basal body rod protein FlgB [Pseudomonas]|uniref:flagellar basal body rod protein FlgB n=1 Tax=Pseudomonas TaxID=286 RepID=UPI00102A0730|nr:MULTISPECIES: flagellar basal body rod protein FlgB [Pseudomonas]MBH8611258.1 flagellar basal body rod protein FlgB [Pseudomonas mohnii]MBM6442979.1 flagellar basal body rod protein FlgB [Pseudomonas sp. MIL9]RZO10917.1 flagellar basal body rod protein FlgB [Pseudomonas moorei]
MIDKLDNELRFQQDAMSLRAERQQVLANNIANADTPNFRARDFDFSAELASSLQNGRGNERGMTLATTSDRHLHAASDSLSNRALLYRVPDQPSLDGNTVDMDRERAQFTDNAVRYQASLTFLSNRLQSLKTAMQSE